MRRGINQRKINQNGRETIVHEHFSGQEYVIFLYVCKTMIYSLAIVFSVNRVFHVSCYFQFCRNQLLDCWPRIIIPD